MHGGFVLTVVVQERPQGGAAQGHGRQWGAGGVAAVTMESGFGGSAIGADELWRPAAGIPGGGLFGRGVVPWFITEQFGLLVGKTKKSEQKAGSLPLSNFPRPPMPTYSSSHGPSPDASPESLAVI